MPSRYTNVPSTGPFEDAACKKPVIAETKCALEVPYAGRDAETQGCEYELAELFPIEGAHERPVYLKNGGV